MQIASSRLEHYYVKQMLGNPVLLIRQFKSQTGILPNSFTIEAGGLIDLAV